MKNLKTYTIIELVLLLLVGGLIWFWGGNQSEKKENRFLSKEYKRIEKQKDSLNTLILELKEDNSKLKKTDSTLQKTIVKVEYVNKTLKRDISTYKKRLDNYRENSPVTYADSLCDDVIASQDSLIKGQTVEIILKDSLIENKTKQTENLEEQITYKDIQYAMTHQQLRLQKDIISNKDLQIKRLKTRNIIVGTSAAAVTVGLILGIIFVK